MSAGNFADLVQRGFYNGMDVQRSDGFVVQVPTARRPTRSPRPTHSRRRSLRTVELAAAAAFCSGQGCSH